MKPLSRFFQRLYKKLKRQKLFSAILKISSGVVISQAIIFLASPLIGRLYLPSDIGEYSLLRSASDSISVFALLGLGMSIMIPREDEQARGLCQFASMAVLLISFIICIILIVISPYIKIMDYSPYILAILLLFLYTSTSSIALLTYAYVNRQGKYNVLFWNPIIGAIVNATLSILFGVLKLGFVGYVVAHIASYFSTILHCILNANPYRKVENHASRPHRIIKQYMDFPRYQMPANVITNISALIPIQYIGNVLGKSVLGIYSMTLRVLALPISLLATPVNRVYYKEATKRYQEGHSIGEFTMKVLEANIKIAILPIAILMVFGSTIFSVLLGEQWFEAGNYAAILGFYYLTWFCSKCLSGNFIIIGRQRINFVFSVILVVVNVVAFAVAYFFFRNDVIITLIIYVLFNSLYQIVMQVVFLTMTGVGMQKVFRFYALYLLLPAVISILVRLVFFL